jgi:hypothetical protein
MGLDPAHHPGIAPGGVVGILEALHAARREARLLDDRRTGGQAVGKRLHGVAQALGVLLGHDDGTPHDPEALGEQAAVRNHDVEAVDHGGEGILHVDDDQAGVVPRGQGRVPIAHASLR